MRVVVPLLVLAGTAHADKARDCYLEAVKQPAPKVTAPKHLGCFEKIRVTEDHAYGFRVCFAVVNNACTGELAVYDGNIEPDYALFDSVTCKANAITFTVSKKWRTSYEDVGPVKLELAFTGKIGSGALRGTLAKDKIVWKQTKAKLDFDRVNVLERVAQCAK